MKHRKVFFHKSVYGKYRCETAVIFLGPHDVNYSQLKQSFLFSFLYDIYNDSWDSYLLR